ncbi:hypothetical protein [Fuchsiella alkaliacetigena]|uniref:hypothetical protein n=1 Tax=Fuchsiella alkaliacetigena TaxID=957042 RepID=UPI00200B83EB|nr:hypothetical protein [Fuchsiella alkaliacetigena]MCK8824876.1 hypothetical protein [Fuchsiella alkaliacetigena]
MSLKSLINWITLLGINGVSSAYFNHGNVTSNANQYHLIKFNLREVDEDVRKSFYSYFELSDEIKSDIKKVISDFEWEYPTDSYYLIVLDEKIDDDNVFKEIFDNFIITELSQEKRIPPYSFKFLNYGHLYFKKFDFSSSEYVLYITTFDFESEYAKLCPSMMLPSTTVY